MLGKYPDDEKARGTADIVVVLPNVKLSDGQYSDDVIRRILESNKTDQLVPYCSTYSAEVMKKGSYDLGRGFTPRSLMINAKEVLGAETRDYWARDYVVKGIGAPTPTTVVNAPTLYIHQKTVPYQRQ